MEKNNLKGRIVWVSRSGGIIVLNEKERRRLEQRYEWNNIRRK